MTVVRSGAASDVGRVRTINQDMVLQTASLFAVADGMGGHVGGEVAAKLAVDTLKAVFGRQASTEGLEQAVSDANAAVWSQGHATSDLRGMGTTLTAAALVVGSDGRDKVALANVGDSRAYLFTAGHLTQITVDHSLAEEKVRYGEMTEAEAAVHPHRHILTRALGVSDGVEVDVWELHLRTGDRLMLCSDGLTNEVPEEEIAQVLSSEPDPQVVATALVNAANRHGGNDNISVLVVDVLVGDDSVATPDIVTSRAARPVTRPRAPVLAVDGSITGAVPQSTGDLADLERQAPTAAPPAVESPREQWRGRAGLDGSQSADAWGCPVDHAARVPDSTTCASRSGDRAGERTGQRPFRRAGAQGEPAGAPPTPGGPEASDLPSARLRRARGGGGGCGLRCGPLVRHRQLVRDRARQRAGCVPRAAGWPAVV